MRKFISKKIKIVDSWIVQDSTKEQILKIDSGTIDSLWHKIGVHAFLPKESKIELSYFVTNEDVQDFSLLKNKWSGATVNRKRLLIDGPKGQKLYLKLDISSNRKGKFPIVKNIKVNFSQVNYLEYLPAFYQENPVNQGFLKRYLAVFETVLQKLENQIEDVSELLDPNQTSSDFLPWLSSWVGAVKDENWPEEKWRDFLSRASVLYKHRGTKKELEEIIKIYTGKYPVDIVERALLKTGNKEYQEVLDELFGDNYSFCVLLKPWQVKSETDQKVIKRIIESEKPAHTIGGFAVLEDKISLDWHTYLEVNTYLTERKTESYLDETNVSIDTIIT